MKSFITENKYLISLWILCGIALIIFCGHYPNILFDVGRECYYPEMILKGKVLYKDLFNIYGPFSYLWNALLYKIFSPNLGVLYFSGATCSFAIVSGIYIIAKKFLSEILSFSIGFFTIVTGVCATHLLGYVLPYSYAMLYGTVGIIYSLWALIKYKETDKTQYFYLSALLGGFCAANKYDFFLYGIFLFIVALCSKNKKVILNFITCFMFIPLICGLVLFLQKLGLNDIINAFNDIKLITHSKSLEIMYRNHGVFFDIRLLKIWAYNFVRATLFCGIFAGAVKLYDKHKILSKIIFIISVFFAFYFLNTAESVVFLVPLTIVTALFAFKNLKNNTPLLYLLIGTITICIKNIWALTPLSYGNYVTPIVICVFLAIIFTFVDRKYEKVFAIFLLIISLKFLGGFMNINMYLSDKITSPKGTVYTGQYGIQTNAVKTVIKLIEKEKPNEIVIYPEGLLINFLTGTESESYYNSMLPMYTESFGEQRYIDSIEKNKPEYIVIIFTDMFEYGTHFLGIDYGLSFGEYLSEKYYLPEEYNKNSTPLEYLIYKRK